MKNVVNIEKIIKDKGIILVSFDFGKKIKTLCVNVKNKRYIGFDIELDKKYKSFYLARELGHITFLEENNDKSGHITTGDYNIETGENKIKQKHIDLTYEFINYIENESNNLL